MSEDTVSLSSILRKSNNSIINTSDIMASSSKFKAPLIFEPSEKHRQTFIILHGRGSTAEKFAEPFQSYPVSPLDESSESKSFREHFPDTKFVFPTASLRRATIWRRSLTHQWFDNWSLDRPEYREDLQSEGLRESSSFVHGLLRQEIDIIGAQNVFLIGLSQGCATSLTALLTWTGPAFAGILGMCGWMPFRKRIEEAIQEPTEDPDDDPFESTESTAASEKVTMAHEWLNEELVTTPEKQHARLTSIPLFLGHGTLDEKVPCKLGKAASQLFSALGFDVAWKEYEDLGHWYSGEMLRDMIMFINSHNSR
jgi:predicted esterase